MSDAAVQPSRASKRTRIVNRYSEPVTVPKPVPRALRSGRMPPELLDAMRLMLQGGATDSEICQAFGIVTDTLYNWRNKSPELAEMMRVHKDGFDIRIERSLAQSAIGYTYESEKIVTLDGAIHRVPITEHVPPSNAAQIFWLKNRQPWAWRDKHELDVTGDLQITEVPDDRKLAMQMLALLREATNGGDAAMIEHEPTHTRESNDDDAAIRSGVEPRPQGNGGSREGSTAGTGEGRRRRFA